MITSFDCKETEKLFKGTFSPRLPHDIQRIARRKLMQIDAAASLSFLRVPPNNQLEWLTGDREGQLSIRINKQWRICFRWDDGNSSHVEIVDYH
ncbi:MAG: type II toxin-antitoxin system RelE/ParE family toxin [Geobacteraceae bacterium]|nr:type II toxin-antitoxin system RelE/ParE family toxin [Geobacteraceae bacterium]